MTASKRQGPVVMLAFTLAAAAWAWTRFDEGWLPHDEGTLAQPAERVLLGELPHRDFDDVYTGGLDWWNALAFRVFGVNLRAMRLALFLVFAAWAPCVFWIATRFVSPLAAVPFATLCVAWSMPVYPAPMPSWYVLFLATFGTAALLRHAENGRRRWLVAAGLCGGLAVLVKITGLHFVAAGMLALAWREPALTANEALPKRPGRVYPAAITLAAALLVAFLVRQVWPLGLRWGFDGEIEQFVFPQAAVAALVVARAWTRSHAPDGARFRTLARLAAPFLLGVALPVAAFVIRFAAGGAVSDLVRGVFILPGRRAEIATTALPPPGLGSIVDALPLLALALLPAPRGRKGLLVFFAAGAAAIALLIALAPFPVLGTIHVGIRHLVPALVLLGGIRLWTLDEHSPRAGRLAALLAVTAFVSLVQFPFSVPIYFFYVAPLVVLAALAVGGDPVRSRPGLLLVSVFLIATALRFPVTVSGVMSPRPTGLLETERSGLKVPTSDAGEYDETLAALCARARGGFVWAGPDSPEMPFLTGLRNPTRTIFDCFDADFGDPAGRSARILAALDKSGVTAVAINQWAAFSGPLPDALLEGIRSRFPKSETIGRYEIAWKE